jgi:hypothetical protein
MPFTSRSTISVTSESGTRLLVDKPSVYVFCLMSTKFCKVKVEENTASEPCSVADAIEAFLQNVTVSFTMLMISDIGLQLTVSPLLS